MTLDEQDVRAWVRDETKSLIQQHVQKKDMRWDDDQWTFFLGALGICCAFLLILSVVAYNFFKPDSVLPIQACANACGSNRMDKWVDAHRNDKGDLLPSSCECAK